jgi:hypothetical protein
MGLAVGVVTDIGQVLRRWGYEYGHYGWCGEADVGAAVAGRGRGPRPVDQVRRSRDDSKVQRMTALAAAPEEAAGETAAAEDVATRVVAGRPDQ